MRINHGNQHHNRESEGDPMGAAKKGAFSLGSGSKLRLEFHSAKVTSDAGLLAYRDPRPLVDRFLVRRAPDAHAVQSSAVRIQ